MTTDASVVRVGPATELVEVDRMAELEEYLRTHKPRPKRMPLYLRLRPQSANELGGTRAFQAPQLLSTKASSPGFSFGGSSSDRLKLAPAASPGPIYGARSTLGGSNVSFGTGEQRPRPAGQRKYARHSRAPGPASYSLPPSIGGSQVLDRMRSSRSSSFGTAAQRALPFSSQETPGAKYSLPPGVTRMGRRENSGFTWSNKPRYPPPDRNAAMLPGPASYSRPSTVGRGNVESTLPNSAAVGFGTSTRETSGFVAIAQKNAKHYPGVGAYNHAPMIGSQLLSDKRSSKQVAFKSADRFKRLTTEPAYIEGNGFASEIADVTPGPGQYVV
mmetsp:Transcript_15431/g.45111  ORF Transcript_15431/g.45111 Transcript_15431/m.45111 type:complete len:330 (-) Transcript_15431:113-1102(-)